MKDYKRFTHLPYLTIALGSAVGMAQNAQAVDFSIGQLDGRLDSKIILGESWSLSERDPNLLGRNSAGGRGFAGGSDDGRLNYDKGDSFSRAVQGTHVLELKSANTGVVIKGRYWYDDAIANDRTDFKSIDDDGRNVAAKSSGAELLDAYIYHNYQINNLEGTVRLGKQILKWGPKSIINPFDASTFFRPGTEPSESLIPVNMLYASQQISENAFLDAFYQLDWTQSESVNCGTFFSPTDFVASGCNGFPVGPDISNNALAQAALEPEGVRFSSEGIFFNRTSKDNTPDDSGQWGLSMRWIVPSLKTEFRPYFVNYHSRQPVVNTIGGPHVADLDFVPRLCQNIGMSDPAACASMLGPSLGSLALAYRIGTSKYEVVYPENIQQYGISFSTNVTPLTVFSGDINFRPNMPIQINGLDEALAVLGDPTLSPPVASGIYPIANNAVFEGYKRKPVTQAQLNILQVIPRLWGSNKIMLLGELGAVYVGALESRDQLRYGRNPVFGIGELADNSVCQATNGLTADNCNQEGFTTAFSWGYRLRAAAEYSTALPSLILKPSLAWSHDVNGYAPEPGFSEGAKSVTVALEAEYAQRYSTSLAATSFFGGDYNINRDRDYLTFSFAVKF